uniref:Group I intronic ORF n=1 Tax=Volvocales sp. NrCl902 TaxID=2682054 RepID=A0A7G1GGB7_9CHLO|nr:group I intronic ORF [Volvocales sp. NrCl902]
MHRRLCCFILDYLVVLFAWAMNKYYVVSGSVIRYYRILLLSFISIKFYLFYKVHHFKLSWVFRYLNTYSLLIMSAVLLIWFYYINFGHIVGIMVTVFFSLIHIQYLNCCYYGNINLLSHAPASPVFCKQKAYFSTTSPHRFSRTGRAAARKTLAAAKSAGKDSAANNTVDAGEVTSAVVNGVPVINTPAVPTGNDASATPTGDSAPNDVLASSAGSSGAPASTANQPLVLQPITHITPSNDVEWGQYLAGLFEGDGHFNTQENAKLSGSIEDALVTERLAAILNLGYVSEVKGKKAVLWNVDRNADVGRLLELMNGHLRTSYKLAQIHRNFKDILPENF